ncbi:MAG: hypothetical protein R3C44_10330 [Chloroflexota bacterium]
MGEVGLDEQQPHVVAFNTWKGVGIPPAPGDALGIRYFTVVLPNDDELQRAIDRVAAAGLPAEETAEGLSVNDPSQISVVLTNRMPSPQSPA